MRNLFIYLVTILLFSTTFIACSDDEKCKNNDDCKDDKVCVDGNCIPDDLESSLLFDGIANQDFIDGYRYDENGEKDGVQITINAKAKNLETDTEITLMFKGDDSSKVTQALSVSSDGTSSVSFEEFTLKNGENTLVLLAKNKNGTDIEAQIIVTAEELSLNISSPLADLSIENDKNPTMHYIQEDVKLDVKGVAVESLVTVKLTLFKVVDGSEDLSWSIRTASPENGQVVFEELSFPEGKWKLVASVDTLNNITVNSPEVVLSAASVGGCNVELLPLTGTVINQKYLNDNPTEQDGAISFKATTNCPVGYNVRFVINPNEEEEKIVPATLSSENGETSATIIHKLVEDKNHNDLPSKVRVEISEDFSNEEADGGFHEGTYFVDTVGPEINVSFPTLNYEFFPLNDLDDSVEGMQFTVSGETVDAKALLEVAVDDGEYKKFLGAVNEDTQKFDTNLLSDDKFVSILGSGSHVIKFRVYDANDNQTVVDVPVRVYLDNINLSITTVATKAIPQDSILKLNKSDDSNTDLENMQFLIEASSEGFDEGRRIDLYIDDTKVLDSNIDSEGKLSFNLNTVDLGLADGEHDIYIRTIENNGPRSQIVKLFVSNTKPVLALTGFTDGDYTNLSPVAFNITTTGLSGDDEQVHFKLNGTDLTPVTVDAQGFAVFTDVSLVSGVNTISVTAEDFEGNVAEPLNFTINFDDEDPNVVITAPLNAAVISRSDDTNNSLAGIQITVNADIDNEVDGTDVKLFLGTNELATGVVSSNKVVFNDVTLLSSIENVLKVEVTDKAGNMSDTSVSVTVDDGCYNLQFVGPTLDNAKLNDDSFTGSVNVGPSGTNNIAADSLSVDLAIGSNNFSSSISGGSASFSGVSLAQGSNTLVLSYNVDGSTPCSTSVTVDYDTSAPVITSLSITDKDSLVHNFANNASAKLGLLYDTGIDAGLQASIKVLVSDIEANQVMQLKVDGSNTETANIECDLAEINCFAEFSSLTLLEGGPYTLTFEVQDVNGNNSNVYTINLNVDTTKPVVAFENDFPISLNTSGSVDEQGSISGIQYNVVAELSDVQAGDIVRFYIDGSLAKMRLNSDLNTEVNAEHTLLGADTSFTFENVTFPLNQTDAQGDPIPYTIKLVVVDESGNQTEDVKNNYKVLDELVVYFADSTYETKGLNKTNSSNLSLSLGTNRAEQGVISLLVADEASPNTIISTLDNNMDGVAISSSFNLAQASDIADDGRYLLTPKFKDQSNFEYLGTVGYLAVKRTAPSINTLSISQDANNNKVLNKVEDGNLGLAGFQTDVIITLDNVYLDSLDCADGKRTLELKQASANGSVLGSSLVNCDGTVTISVTLPESSTSYVLYASLTDNFGNSLSNSNQGSVTVDVTDPVIGTVVANTANGAKSFANNIKFLANEDTNSSLAGFQSNLVISTSGNANLVKIDSTPAELNTFKAPVNGSSDFGTVTINDGTYSFLVTATDAAGNIATTTFTGITVDTLVPELNLSMAKTTVVDSDDEDSGTIGIQITATVNAMANIETGQTIFIQKSDDGVSNWTNLDSFVKAASNSSSLVLTLPVGTYKLRATASDLNTQQGYSSLVDMSVTSASCSIVSVKKGSVSLGAGDNYFNANDVVGGNVSLTVALTSSCGGHTLTAKKGSTNSASVVIDSTTEVLSIPFSNGEAITLNFDVNSTPSALASFSIIVDTVSPSVVRATPSVSLLSYVNSDNPSILAPSIIGDTSGDAGAQVTLTVTVSGADGGSVEMISNDGTSDVSHSLENVTSDSFAATFTGKTLADDKVHSLSFKVTDLAGNTTTTQLYTATVDVTNPGNIATLAYDAITDTERRTAELNLTWNQEGTGDNAADGNLAKYVIKYSQTSFDASTFEALTGHEEVTVNNPSMLAATFMQLVSGLVFHKDYTIGVRAYDELGNASNVIIATTGTDLNLAGDQLTTTGFDINEAFENVKNVGDVNDDGHDDFVVTQSYGNSQDGKVYVYYGTGDPSTLSAPQIIDGVADSFEAFGTSITSGDFDGDGKTDLLVGSIWSDSYWAAGCNWGCYGGGVYVLYNQGSGAPLDITNKTFIQNLNLQTPANLKTLGNYQYAEFGTSIDYVGKINGSAFDSFIIGQKLSSDGGRAFLIEGRAGRPATIDVASVSNVVELAHDFGSVGEYGKSVAGLGDIDKNGTVDVAVGDFINKKVSVFHLESNVYSNSILTAKADNTGDAVILTNIAPNYGNSLVANVDLNNDGNKDFVVSGLTSGVFVYYGNGSDLTSSTPYIRLNDIAEQNSWNNNLSVADFNGDNKADFIIGAENKLNIYLSKSANFITGADPDIVLDASEFTPNTTGILKATGFDANEDGVDDIILCDFGTKNCYVKY